MSGDSTRQVGDTAEVEVTPAMIEAGVSAFGDYDPGFDPLGPILRDVFVAMIRAGRDNEAL